MTAEIAILNQSSASLAADSAATSWAGGRYRITNEALKIFPMDQKTPLAIMIYGSADILGHPWHAIIGEFSAESSRNRFGTIEDLGHEFFRFLESRISLFPAEEQERWFALMVNVVFSEIVHEAKIRLQFAGMTGNRDLTPHQALAIAVNRIYQIFFDGSGNEQPNLDCFDGLSPDDVYKMSADTIDSVIADRFSEYEKDDEIIAKLRKIAVFSLVKDEFLERLLTSGIVFAGYGGDDLYPGYTEYMASTIFANRVKRKQSALDRISNQNQASIAFFAQSDASLGFLRGIDDDTAGFLFSASEFLVNVLGGHFAQSLDFLSEADRNKVADRMKSQFNPAFMFNIQQALDQKVKEDRIIPFLDVVANMGPKEMTDIAYELVNLNVVRKKVINEAPTVNTPIRVCTITKQGGCELV